MARKIFSLGRKLPTDAVENISLDSGRSLLDADIIVFEPNFNDFVRDGDYKNRPLLTDKDLRSGRTITPVPEWAQQSSYRMSEEATLEARIKETSEQIETLHAERATLRNDLENAGNLRWLLYESGHPLEEAIREALRLLGFKAETYKKGDSEFDIVFISEEGRFHCKVPYRCGAFWYCACTYPGFI